MVKKKEDISVNLSGLLSLPVVIAKFMGFNNTEEILEKFNNEKLNSYVYSDGKSNYLDSLLYYKTMGPYDENSISEYKLKEYDQNISEYLEIINKKRDIKLKPFQYLAILYTEIYLDRWFKNKQDLLESINIIIINENKKRAIKFKEYKLADLDKICFWMATGSGKTIILHANYLQYLYYAKKYNQVIKNKILLTPNEDLSKQHEIEFQKSSISAYVSSNLSFSRQLGDIVKIYDFNKIKDKDGLQSKDKGVTIDYREFGKNNVIFVDEGHRGSKGNSWLDMRNKISTDGFVFEYSATYHDIINNKDIETDYQKQIIFDYSYKYFYKAGYGKNYDISNLPDKENKNNEEYIKLGSLLSFFEQKLYYLKNESNISKYNLENPLWLLVGSKVNPSKDLDKKTTTDIKEFILFVNSLKSNKENIVKKIQDIFENKTNIKIKDTDRSFFEDKYIYLRKQYDIKVGQKYSYEKYVKILEDIYNYIFYTTNSGSKLVLANIKSADGEIGLKFSDSADDKFFGLVYIGKGSEKGLIENICKNNDIISIDSISHALFEGLNKKDNNINILIGAKKFIEGWDNYRISSLLLLNFAKGQGASAIQLFGRGVRLKGYDKSLLRSNFVKPYFDEDISVLETLFVYGIHADYMEAFRNELDKDSIDYIITKRFYITSRLPDEKLYCIKTDYDSEKSDVDIKNIYCEESFFITVDLTQYINRTNSKKEELKYDSSKKKINRSEIKTFCEYLIQNELIDWNKIYKDVIRLKRQGNFSAIYIGSIEELKNYYNSNFFEKNVEIRGDNLDKLRLDIIINKKQFNKLSEVLTYSEDMTEIYSDVIKTHIKKAYYKDQKLKVLNNYSVGILGDPGYDYIINEQIINISVSKDQSYKGSINKEIISELIQSQSDVIDLLGEDRKLLDLIRKKQEIENPVLAELENHIYFPLLVKKEDLKTYTFSPSGLNDGELEFVNVLKAHLIKNSKRLENKKIYLLRNHENKGVSFTIDDFRFFYDFILWVIEKDCQKIYFIDPKGLATTDYKTDKKIEFNEGEIKNIESKIKKECKINLELDTAIISVTAKNLLSESIKSKKKVYDSAKGFCERNI